MKSQKNYVSQKIREFQKNSSRFTYSAEFLPTPSLEEVGSHHHHHHMCTGTHLLASELSRSNFTSRYCRIKLSAVFIFVSTARSRSSTAFSRLFTLISRRSISRMRSSRIFSRASSFNSIACALYA